MPILRRASIAAVAVLALSSTAAVAGTVDEHRTTSRPSALTHLERPAEDALRASYAAPRDGELQPTTFVGLDGLFHSTSPVAVAGRGGFYYIGSDFDTACAYGGHLKTAMKGLSRLADILQRAGKKVAFTVAPNKSAVVRGELPQPLPQGACSRRGMRVQAKILDRYRDPRYLPLRRSLVKLPNSYWRTDSHWNTVGSSVFAEHLAEALSPRLAALQKYKRTKRTKRGDLAPYVPGLGAETVRARVPRNGVRTRPAGDSPAYDPSLQSVYTDLSWTSKPARKTFPGRTLILGDSFTYVSTEALSNLFRRGRFMWIGYHKSMADIVAAVNAADTVVFAVVQRYAPISPLAEPTFQDELRAQLR